VSPLPPNWTPPTSLPSRGPNACATLKPLVAFFKGATVTGLFQSGQTTHGYIGGRREIKLG
jgi:hypothetical protein